MIEKVDDLEIYYEVYGRGEKLVLLHGWGVDHHELDPLVPLLSQNFQLVLPDLPGFGQSSKLPRAFDTSDYAAVLSKFLGQLEIRNFFLAGHSFGGAISLILASRQPSVKKLVLLDSAGLWLKNPWTNLKIKIFKLLKKALPQSKETFIKKILGSEDYRRAGPLRETFVKVVNDDLRPLLGQIKVPTLIIWGKNDTVTSLEEAQIFHQEIRGSRLKIIPGTGHLPQIDKPNEVARAIINFLEEEDFFFKASL